jgi:hypothetical protein
MAAAVLVGTVLIAVDLYGFHRSFRMNIVARQKDMKGDTDELPGEDGKDEPRTPLPERSPRPREQIVSREASDRPGGRGTHVWP